MSAEASSSGAPAEELIPKAEFIEDVAACLAGRTVDVVIADFQERYRKFKLLEAQLLQRRARLMQKLPEIQKALDIVTKLIELEGGEMMSDFELADGVFAKTRMKGVQTVNLWLGAGVMVEYALEEARELLETNLNNCKHNIKAVTNDMEINKDNITTIEVSIARIYNFDVERRRKEKEGGSA